MIKVLDWHPRIRVSQPTRIYCIIDPSWLLNMEVYYSVLVTSVDTPTEVAQPTIYSEAHTRCSYKLRSKGDNATLYANLAMIVAYQLLKLLTKKNKHLT